MDFVGVPNRSLLLNESAFACGDASDENDSEYVNPLHNTGLKILFILLYSVVFVFAFVGKWFQVPSSTWEYFYTTVSTLSQVE